MGIHHATTQHRLITVALAALLGALIEVPTASADPSASAPATAAATVYNHAPVTFWLVPHVGLGGLSSKRLRTNFALSLGASGYARLDGVDVSVGASWVTESVQGLQVTSGFNYAGTDLRGVQIAAGANVTRQRVMGLQVSSGLNYGGVIEGAQIGIVNVGGDVDGAQIGIVNVARRVRGAQIGIVNVAQDSSAPVGLVSLVRDGQHHVGLWSSDSAPVNLGVKLGGRYVYGLVTAGYEQSDNKKRWLTGVGIGGHVPLGERFFLEPELLQSHVNEGLTWSDTKNELTTLRLIGGFRAQRHLSFFAGPTFNLLVTKVGHGEGFGLIHGTRITSAGSATTMRVWPGFAAGFQI